MVISACVELQYQASNSHVDSTIRGKVDRQEQLRTFFDMQDAAGFWEGIFV